MRSSRSTRVPFLHLASYNLKGSHTSTGLIDHTPLQEPQCQHLRTGFLPPFLSLDSCSVPFHSTGTFKVRESIHIIWVFLRMYGSAWNTGTCLYMIWVGLGCLVQFINSIVWSKNMINRAPVYCDISKLFAVLTFVYPLILLPHSDPFASGD